MSHQGTTELEGVVTEALPNTMFRVKTSDGSLILVTLTGRMRRNFVRILPGDKVRIEVTPYDKLRGRITFRYK